MCWYVSVFPAKTHSTGYINHIVVVCISTAPFEDTKYPLPQHIETEIRINIQCQPILVKYILTQIKISWIRVNYGDPLLYPVSVSNCPSPERGVFCIFIVDLISKRALMFFSLVRARNYHYYNVIDITSAVCFGRKNRYIPTQYTLFQILHWNTAKKNKKWNWNKIWKQMCI